MPPKFHDIDDGEVDICLFLDKLKLKPCVLGMESHATQARSRNGLYMPVSPDNEASRPSVAFQLTYPTRPLGDSIMPDDLNQLDAVNPNIPDAPKRSFGLLIGVAGSLVAGLLFGTTIGAVSQWFGIFGILAAIAGFIASVPTARIEFGNKTMLFAVRIVAVLIAGVAYVISFHAGDYYVVQYRLGPVDPEERRVAQHWDELRAKYAEQTPEVQELINLYASDTRLRDLMAADSLLKYVDFKARLGVTLSKRGREDRLGDHTSYGYWVLDGLVFVATACVIPHMAFKVESVGSHRKKLPQPTNNDVT